MGNSKSKATGVQYFCKKWLLLDKKQSTPYWGNYACNFMWRRRVQHEAGRKKKAINVFSSMGLETGLKCGKDIKFNNM